MTVLAVHGGGGGNGGGAREEFVGDTPVKWEQYLSI